MPRKSPKAERFGFAYTRSLCGSRLQEARASVDRDVATVSQDLGDAGLAPVCGHARAMPGPAVVEQGHSYTGHDLFEAMIVYAMDIEAITM